MQRCSWWLNLILLCLPSLLLAQISEYQVNLFKDELSWNWLGRLTFYSPQNSRSRFSLEEKFTSNLFSETARRNKWRDENDLKASWSYQLAAPWKTATQLNSEIFSDENSAVKFSKHLLLQEVTYLPRPAIAIAPAAGWASEDIYQYRDQGWYSQLRISINQYDLGGYSNTSTGSSSIFFFPERRNQAHRYYVAFSRHFSESASDSLQVGYEMVGNSYPLPAGTVAEKVLEEVGINARYLYNDLNYRFTPRTILQIETKLQNRDITQSNQNLHNRRQEYFYANRVGVRYSSPRFMGNFAFSTSQNTNLSSRTPAGSEESRTDIDGLQSAFHLMLNWFVGRSDEVLGSFSYIKYEYSSPDTAQTVDEDDLRFITDLQYRHRFSQYVTLQLQANLYLYHQIYIHPSRSANNNWNRIYQLAATMFYRPGAYLENSYQIKILANYTVYDFEEVLPEIRSYVFRKLIFTDTLKIQLSDGIRLNGLYQLEKEDNGTFFQDLFSQQINRELTSHFIDLGLTYHRIKGIEITSALNWYWRKEWVKIPEDRQVRDYFALNPRLAVLYNLGKRLYLYAIYSPRGYRDINLPHRYFTTGQVNLRYLF